MSGNGEYFFRWKRGEVNHPIDGRAFAHSIAADTPEDLRERSENPYPTSSKFAESTIQLMNSIENRATKLLGYSPVRHRKKTDLAPLSSALLGKMTP